jgi:DNA-binding MarR family transcriptional regulator
VSEAWTLMNSHGIVLFYIAAHPETTMREMSSDLELTERRVAQIVRDLSNSDLLDVKREGRRNAYSVNRRASFRHPTLTNITLGQFEDLLTDTRHQTPSDQVMGSGTPI